MRGDMRRGRPIGAVERHGAREPAGPIEADRIEHVGDEVGLLAGEALCERLLADMIDQTAFPGDELQLFLGVPVEEPLIDLPAIAQIDLEGSCEVGDMVEREYVLRVGGADDGEDDLCLPVGQAPDRRDLGAIVEVR